MRLPIVFALLLATGLVTVAGASDCRVVRHAAPQKHCAPVVHHAPHDDYDVPFYLAHLFRRDRPILSYQFYAPNLVVNSVNTVNTVTQGQGYASGPGYAPPAGYSQPAPQAPYANFPGPGNSGPDFPAVQGGNFQASAPGEPHVVVFRQHCASCHTGQGKGGVSIFDGSNRYAPNVSLGTLYDAMDRDENPMPRDGQRVPRNQLAHVRKMLTTLK